MQGVDSELESLTWALEAALHWEADSGVEHLWELPPLKDLEIKMTRWHLFFPPIKPAVNVTSLQVSAVQSVSPLSCLSYSGAIPFLLHKLLGSSQWCLPELWMPRSRVLLQIPFAKDCGNKERCVSDLTLDVSTTEKNLLIVRSQNDKFNVSLTVKNKWDSAYNTRTVVQYSPNLIFSGIEVNIVFLVHSLNDYLLNLFFCASELINFIALIWVE